MKQRLFRLSGLFVLLSLLICVFPSPLSAQDRDPVKPIPPGTHFFGHPTVCSVVNRLNIREKPNINSKVIGKLLKDTCGTYAGAEKLPYPLPQWVEISQTDVHGDIKLIGFVASRSLNTGQPYLDVFPIPNY